MANPDADALNELLFADDKSLQNEGEKVTEEHTSNLNVKISLIVRLKE